MKNSIKSILRVDNIKWFILAILLLIPFVSFCYMDTKSIIHYQINFADALLSGKIGDFYDICYERTFLYNELKVGGAHFATYDIVMHALLGIWGIPLYLWCAWKGVQEVLYNTSCILYGKAIYIPALIISAYLIYKICRELKIEKERCEWACYLFCSSLLVFTSVCVIGQSDILAIPLILAGLFYYIKEDNKRFVAFFMIAVSFKLFAFFVFIPLLLLREKRVIRIVGSIITVYSLSFLANLPYTIKNTLAIKEKMNFNQAMFFNLTARNLPILDGNVSLFVLIMGLLCVYCYLKPIDTTKQEYDSTIYIALLGMGIVFLSFSSFPYWYIHLAPYLAIVAIYYYDRWNVIMLFETFGIIVLTLENYIKYSWCYDLENTDNMLLQKMFERVNDYSVTLEQIMLKYEDYQSILNAAFAVSLIAIMWLAQPRKMELYECGNNELAKGVYIRLIINVVVAYIPILIYMMDIFCA